MNRKRINKKWIILIVIIVLLVLLVGTIGAYYLLNKNDTPIEHKIYNEFDMVGGKIDDNTYYLLGVSNDINFEVIKKDNFSYEIKDAKDNKIHSQLVDNVIKPPQDLYEEGMTYYLKINNGTFKDSKYDGINKIIFKVIRPSKQDIKVKDTVFKINTKDITIDDKNIKLNKNYKENDIILVYDNDKLVNTYKIGKYLTANKYEYSIPKVEEVFDDIDYYGMERIDLSGYVNNKDFNLFLNTFIHTVYAKEDVTIKKPVWNEKDETLEVGITVYTNNKKEFLVNHDAKVELTLVLSIDLYKDITLDNYDYALKINYDIKINNSFNHINDNFNNLYDAIKAKDVVENYDTKWLENNYNDLLLDKKLLEKGFGNITIETKTPGLYLNIDMGIMMDISNKGYINSNLSGNNALFVGINKDNKIYSDYSFNNKGEASFIGDNSNKIAGIINTKLSFINIFDMNVKMTSGIYTNGKSNIKVDNEDDKQTKINYEIKGDNGFFAKYLIEATGIEQKTIYDDKITLNKNERNIKIIGKKQEEKKEEDKKEEEKTNYRYSADEVRKMLQNGYDALDEYEEWNTPMMTITTHFISEKSIDVNNNTFTEKKTYDDTASYTCIYNYVTKEMKCDNFEETQSYVKSTCDNAHNDYLNYLKTGEINNEEAKEWDNLYSDISSCYYEAIYSSKPTDYNDDIQNILDQVELTFEDLKVLEN